MILLERATIRRKAIYGTADLGLFGSIIGFAGLWLATGHWVSAFVCFITIIGIPFGLQHLKFAHRRGV